jgi:DNA repair exonuclease SbcCD nuclease subunit
MFILGDIHGNFTNLINLIDKIGDTSPIIQVGDFGMTNNHGNMKNILNLLNNKLGQVGNKMYVIRGNHDNPNYWNGDWLLDNIELLPDYSVREIEGKNILFVGGALSIDRASRIMDGGHYYWVDEEFFLDKKKLKSFKGLDVVITHTAPQFAPPQTINDLVRSFAQYDPSLLTELAIERGQMSEMYKLLVKNNYITHWFYGHFHTNSSYTYENTEFVCVHIDTTYDFRV